MLDRRQMLGGLLALPFAPSLELFKAKKFRLPTSVVAFAESDKYNQMTLSFNVTHHTDKQTIADVTLSSPSRSQSSFCGYDETVELTNIFIRYDVNELTHTFCPVSKSFRLTLDPGSTLRIEIDHTSKKTPRIISAAWYGPSAWHDESGDTLLRNTNRVWIID